jgi:hypothetical protein
MDFFELFKELNILLGKNPTISESWGFLDLKGNYYPSIVNEIIGLSSYLQDIGKGFVLTTRFDNTIIPITDLNDYVGIKSSFDIWDIHLNKLPLIYKDPQSNFSCNFFCQTSQLGNWIDELNPFDPKNPFIEYSPIKIITNDLLNPIIGPNIRIIPSNSNSKNEVFPNEKYSLPDSEQINEMVHILTNEEICISPKNFTICKETVDCPLKRKLLKLSSLSLAASIVSEFHSEDKVVLDGIRLINITLSDSSDCFSESLNSNLIKLIEWIYSEKIATRLKLFLHRLTLEINEKNTLIYELNIHLESALDEATQRYNFVILERKDKYIAELKDLLKDIRTQSDLYSQKIRNLLNNLLRDILAALILVGFTIFTKFSDNIQLDKEQLLNYVFTGLAIYYVISIIFQTVVDIVDVQVSKREMLYWKNTTKELLPEGDFIEHISKSLKGRRISLRIIYPLIISAYLLVAFTCYQFPSIFHQISNNKTKNDQFHKGPTPADSSSQSRK